ncbi:MAG: hypothetical protein HC803_06100 [Saprospiraceae bacterium]|nr:hypothetical protein [Saprospiraceae bacterium]
MNEIVTNVNEIHVKKTKRHKGFLIAIGVIILGILSLATFFLLNNRTTNLDLFTDNFKPFPDVIINRNKEPNDYLTIGMAAYNHQDYTIATMHLEQFLGQSEISEDNKKNTSIYIAVSYLALGNVNAAVKKFEKIKHENFVLEEVAEWYLALTYLKKNDLENCKKQLKAIQNGTKHQYRLEAEQLLKKWNL